MSTSSTRAQAVAEILWQLKRADKLATFTAIAVQAGFSPGASGRTVTTCLKTVRRDWPHLQWWRAVADNGQLEKGCEQEKFLVEAGFEVEVIGDECVVIKSLESQMALPDGKADGEDVEEAS